MHIKLFLAQIICNFSLYQLSSSFTINNLEWRDLDWDGTYLDADFATFTTSFGYGTTTCLGKTIPGGYNNWGNGDWIQKTYSGFPDHDVIYISFNIWIIDSVDTEEGLKIYINGAYVCSTLYYRIYDLAAPVVSDCGNTAFNDLGPIKVIIVYPSSATSLTLKFIGQFNQARTDESSGVRDIKFVFKSGTESSSCVKLAQTFDYTAPCSPGYFYSGSCQPCNISCDECFGSTNADCYACRDGYYFSGTECLPCGTNCRTCYSSFAQSCTSCLGNNYLYPDNSCQTSCLAPKTSTGGPPYTCACSSAQYLHSDYQCSVCASPFKISGIWCLSPCAPGLYYFANGTCGATCPAPFTSVLTYTQLFCNFPCSKTSYYFANGTCSSYCPKYYGVSNISVSSYCIFPCLNPTPYLMDNGTCVSECDTPFFIWNVYVGDECKYQCNPAEYYFLNRTCKTTCPSPFTIGDKYYWTDTCNFPCARNEYYYANATCLTSCTFPFVKVNISVSAYCNFPCSATEFYYQNNSCRGSCVAPFVPISISVSSFCNFQCSMSQYYYSNGSCLTTCPSPFYVSSISMGQFCNFPCPSGQYYYANATCLGSCTGAFVVSSITIGDYCNFICPSATFYYRNGSCLPSCPKPFISTINSVSKICDFPCGSGEYYYINATCRSSCPSPFSIDAITIGSYCNFPCPRNQYYYSNTSCLPSCSSPLIAKNVSVGGYCNFPCPTGQFYYWNKSCLATCPTPFLTVSTNIGDYCNYPCTSTQYLYQNDSCISSCAYPFTSQNDGSGGLRCNYICNLGEYIYANFTCSSVCGSPFNQVNLPIEKYCNFPCPIVQFLYPDNSCRRSCNSPFVTTNMKVGYICNFPCTPGNYYYSNTSCLSSCDQPFTINAIDIGSYCNFPCAKNKYLYQNSSCLSTCNNPFSIVNVSVGAFCNFPCNRNEYLYANGTCSPVCMGYPFQAINISVGGICKFPCSSIEYFYINNTCLNKCSSPFYTVSYSVGLGCYFPCAQGLYYYPNSTCLPNCLQPLYSIENIIVGNYCIANSVIISEFTLPILGEIFRYLILGTMAAAVPSLIAGSDPFLSFSFLFLIQGFFFLLFFNVNYPPIILSILGYFSCARFNFLPNPVYWIIDEIPNLPSPKNFHKNDYTGFFLYTAGPSILIMLMTLLIYLYSLLFGKILRMNRLTRSAGIILNILKLAFMMRVFASIYSELVYSTLLQTLEIDFSSDLRSSSTLISFFFFGFCTIFPLVLFFKIKTARSYHALKKYSIIVEDYDINTGEKKYFTFFVYVRKYIHCAAVTLFYYIPILQTIVPFAINLVIVVMLFLYKPHHKPILNFTDSFNELGNFILHTCVVVLAYYDSQGDYDMDRRQAVGWVMLVTISIVLIFNVMLSWFEYIITFYKACVKLKKVEKIINSDIIIRYDPSKKYLTKAWPVRDRKLWLFELKKAKAKQRKKGREVVYQKKIKIP